MSITTFVLFTFIGTIGVIGGIYAASIITQRRVLNKFEPEVVFDTLSDGGEGIANFDE